MLNSCVCAGLSALCSSHFLLTLLSKLMGMHTNEACDLVWRLSHPGISRTKLQQPEGCILKQLLFTHTHTENVDMLLSALC